LQFNFIINTPSRKNGYKHKSRASAWYLFPLPLESNIQARSIRTFKLWLGFKRFKQTIIILPK